MSGQVLSVCPLVSLRSLRYRASYDGSLGAGILGVGLLFLLDLLDNLSPSVIIPRRLTSLLSVGNKTLARG